MYQLMQMGVRPRSDGSVLFAVVLSIRVPRAASNRKRHAYDFGSALFEAR